MKQKIRILLIEDDLLSRLSLKSRLESVGVVDEAQSAQEALDALASSHYDLAFVDLDLESQLAGLKVLGALKLKEVHSVVLSGREDDSIIEEAYRLGCNDYLSKPFSKDSIEAVIKKYQHANTDLLGKLKEVLLTNDEELQLQLKTIEQAVFGNHPILLTGESGTGKTFLAKYIHELIGVNRPFVHLNCSEISENLLESELFGHEKGAFTGAVKTKKGLMELASGGILFLDEIATLPINLQKKLLKAIEEKTFYPVGSEKSVSSDFRLVSATCEDLKSKVKKGEFREDFLYRLEGFNVYLKSLRERKSDIDSLINFFLKKNKRRIVLSKEARASLCAYSWPGNIRELQKVIEVLRSSDKGIIEEQDVAFLLSNTLQDSQENSFEEFNLDHIKAIGLPAYLEKIESQVLEKALGKNQGKVRKTLTDLKISNNSFYRIMTNVKARGADHAEAQ